MTKFGRLRAVLLLLASPIARAELPIESTGRSESLPEPASPHWVWVSDGLPQRAAIVDLDGRGFLGDPAVVECERRAGSGLGLPRLVEKSVSAGPPPRT